MAYFTCAEPGNPVIGLVFGNGIIRNVWPDSHYLFEVEYDNGQVVPYTADGIPGWHLGKFALQTVYYPHDINLTSVDIKPNPTILSPKEIIELRSIKRLAMRCPSGIWMPTTDCPANLIEEALESGQFHLFKRKD